MDNQDNNKPFIKATIVITQAQLKEAVRDYLYSNCFANELFVTVTSIEPLDVGHISDTAYDVTCEPS
jgi:hypothetical protein